LFAMKSVFLAGPATAVAAALPAVLALTVAVASAQAPAQPPAGQTPAPTQKPAAPAPAQTPPPAPQPPAPFPQGAKVAVVNLQLLAQLSSEGKSSTAKVQALVAKKQQEVAAKTKALQDAQNKLAQGGTLLSDAARAQLEREVERQQVDADRFQQDAQAEIQELQTELQGEFQRKLFPVLEEMVKEKGLHALFSAADSGLIWVDPGIDLTAEAIKRFDAAITATPAAAPAAPPNKP
jgi:Skp family chaperone for outer membrane proteins